MSNCVENVIIVHGPREQIDALLKKAYKEADNPFCFDCLLPMPHSLKCCEGSTTTACIAIALYEECHGEIPNQPAYKEIFNPFLFALPKGVKRKTRIYNAEYQRYCSMYDASLPQSNDMNYLFDSFGWIASPISLADARYLGHVYMENIKKYGCPNWSRWTRQNWGCRDGNTESILEDDGGNTVMISVETRNAPPDKLFLNVQQEYPLLKFSGKYSDEGWSLLGNGEQRWKAWSIENGHVKKTE